MKTLANIFENIVGAMVTFIIGVIIVVILLCTKDAIERDKEDLRNYGMNIGTSGVEVTYKPNVENIIEDTIDEFSYVIENGIDSYVNN